MICCTNSALVHESHWSFSRILQSSWHHCGILKSAVVGMFPPWKSRTYCFNLSCLFTSTWLDIWSCVYVWLSWTEFLWLPSFHMCESTAWGWGDSAVCHFLMESMLEGGEVGISKWNISFILGSDVWLNWCLLSLKSFTQKMFRLNKMLSKVFHLPISDLAAELQHTLIPVRSGSAPGRGQSGFFPSAALSQRALDTCSYTSHNSSVVIRKRPKCCYVIEILKPLCCISRGMSLHTLTRVGVVCKGLCVHAWSLSCSDSLRPMDYPPASSVHVILQARITEWVAISNSKGCSWPRD